MRHAILQLLLISLSSSIQHYAFSPPLKILESKALDSRAFRKPFYMADDDTQDDNTEIVFSSQSVDAGPSQTMTPSPRKEQYQRLDPLIQSLTRNDANIENLPSANLPLLGEVPLDASVVVLAPVALIAVVGFVLSIQIGLQSKDAIVQQLDEINSVLSQPPMKQSTVIDESTCRGLCSDQTEQLNSMKGFLEGLSRKKSIMLEE
jgi:hypothetical protein